MRIDVALGDRSYPILIDRGLLDHCDPLIDLARGRQVAVVSNDRVGPLYAARLAAGISSVASKIIHVTLPDGEANKDWLNLNRIFDVLLEHRFDRKTLIVALGGGVVGDMAGFAAALYQRGIEFVQVPTTLLAQVDSSVGGKTAINHPQGKNMIGAFHQPRLVISDVDTLQTLPDRELSAGLAEVIKHGLMADPDYLDTVERDLPALLAKEPAALIRAVAGSCEIKARVVAADERESGLRANLNFGHTFGHAIESGMGYGRWLHGEAVGCGMLMACDLSQRLGLIDAALTQRARRLLVAAHLPVQGPAWTPEQYLQHMEVDKKAEQGAPRFIVLQALGKARMQRVPIETLFATLRSCGAT